MKTLDLVDEVQHLAAFTVRIFGGAVDPALGGKPLQVLREASCDAACNKDRSAA